MGSIKIQGVSKQFATQKVLTGVTLELSDGEVVGLVGNNGSGKTTLLRLIARTFPPDLGTVTRSKGLAVGYLSQEPDVRLDRTLHEEMGSAFEELLALEKKLHDLSDALAAAPAGPEQDDLMARYDRMSARFETNGGYTFVQRLNEVLGGLGFSQADHDLPMSAMSGGQKCRAALGKLLLRDHSFLLLDEPTNHLDIDAVRWLEKFLASHHGGAVIVSHDRYLLDRLVDRVVEVANTRARSYTGNYTTFVETRRVRELTQQRQYEKDKEFIEKERAFIAKHLAGQRTKEAQGRRTRLDRRIRDGEFVLEQPEQRKQARFKFDAASVGGGPILRVEDLAKSYGDKTLFTGLGFQIPPGERFGITGPNGTGKTTLLKILVDQVEADNGTIEFAPKISIGYYAQESHELDPKKMLLEEMRDIRPDMSEHEARSFLAQFNFTRDDVFKLVGSLSGGEQSRLRLIRLIVSAPALLILDEPTNHLDIASREALEEALKVYTGTIVVVSHDRYFLDRTVDRLLVIRTDQHELYAGNYTYYLEQIERRQSGAKKAPRSAGGSTTTRSRNSRGKRKSAQKRVASPFDGMSLDALEQHIVEREERIASLNERFADPEVFRDPQKLAALQTEFDEIKDELSNAERSWSNRADQ